MPLIPIIRQEADDPICVADAARRPRRGLGQLVRRAGRGSLDAGLLDDRGERLLRHPPRLEEAREAGAFARGPHAASRMGWAQLGDPQLDRASPGLPVPVAVAARMMPCVKPWPCSSSDGRRALASGRALGAIDSQPVGRGRPGCPAHGLQATGGRDPAPWLGPPAPTATRSRVHPGHRGAVAPGRPSSCRCRPQPAATGLSLAPVGTSPWVA